MSNPRSNVPAFRNFLQEYVALSKGLVPEMLSLLRKNMIANAEQLLHELVE